jgi:hypothetical protein
MEKLFICDKKSVNKKRRTMSSAFFVLTIEAQVERSDKKAIIFDMMIDIAEKEYNISIRKNSSPEQSISIEKNIKKA